MSILKDLEIVDGPVVNEELSIILDEMDSLLLDSWSYDFIMDMAEKDWLSNKQSAKITEIYKKFIDEDI